MSTGSISPEPDQTMPLVAQEVCGLHALVGQCTQLPDLNRQAINFVKVLVARNQL